MEYDFRKSNNPPPSYSGPQYPMYPRVNPQPGQQSAFPTGPPRPAPYHPSSSASPPSSSSSGLGIRVALKPEYRVTPPPQLPPQVEYIPHSNFKFDFDLERKILAEAENESQNWSRLGLESLPPKSPEPTSSSGPAADPMVTKYVASGLNREAVSLAVAHYGDNPVKVKEFCNGFSLLREMGFSSNNVAEALIMYDNDTERALAYFLNNPS